MKIEAISVYMDNIPFQVRDAQKAVWDKFYPNMMNHHHTYLSHAKTLDKIVELTDADILIIADIDAIPLNENIVHRMADLANAGYLVGNAQSSSHLPDTEHIFIAPSFMALNVKKYRELGSPSFEVSKTGDVAQDLTRAWQKEYPIMPLFPIHYETAPVPVTLPSGTISAPRFWVTGNRPYGLNTTFSLSLHPDTFHGFQSSHYQHERFIHKCLEVLDGKVWSANNHYKTVQGFFTYPELYLEAVSKAERSDLLIEVGSYKGQSACFMAEAIRNSQKDLLFVCVDHFQGSEEHTEKDFYHQFLLNTAPLSRWIHPIKEDSITASQRFKDNDVFFVFIDASHDYDSVKADIEAWLPKVRKGGILAGHDWHHQPVKDAVTDVLGEVEPYTGGCWVKYL